MQSIKFVLYTLLSMISMGLNAQNSPDCRTAIPVCADAPIMGYANGNGDIDDFDPDVIRMYDCLEKGSVSSANVENNASWFVFRTGTGGQLGFDIESLPVGGSGTPTAEWDFIVFGPDPDCNAISMGTAPVAACNYEVNTTNFTGIGTNPVNGQDGGVFVDDVTEGNGNTYSPWLEVQPGEMYYILINNYNTNFDNEAEHFKLTFTGSSVDADQNSALDCTLRDEFLGLDIFACNGDPDIPLSALNSPAGPDILNVAWMVDYDDDGTIDAPLGSGPSATQIIVESPDSGRYFIDITTSFGHVTDDILITFNGAPGLDRIELLNSNLNLNPDKNTIEFFAEGEGDFEYAINGGEFQDASIFNDVPPGLNTVIINDKNGCGTTAALEFLVVGYPKFFTPNSDGMNDTWNIKGMETLIDPTVLVFDRYGKLMAQLGPSTDWDGTINGTPLPSSDYWFRLEYRRQADGVMVAKSTRTHFTLKR